MNKKWFEKDYENLVEAMEYLIGFQNYMVDNIDSKHKDVIEKFLSDYEQSNSYKFIFESNNIEQEGLDEHDTKKMVIEGWNIWEEFIEACPSDLIKIANHFNSFDMGITQKLDEKVWNLIEDKILSKTNEEIDEEFGLPKKFLFGGRLKDSQIAFNQFLALMYAKSISYSNMAKLLKTHRSFINKILRVCHRITSKLCSYIGLKKISRKLKHKSRTSLISKEIINEDQIKKLHKLLAHKTDNNNNGMPGEYRPDNACVGIDVVFMEPALVENSVRNLLDKFNKRDRGSMYIPFLEGCRVSEELVKIHPFGDFNGRLSRIVLSLCLMRTGYPFWLILRSDNTSKKRYFDSVKRSYSGNSSYYISLVSQMFVEQIYDINSRLKIAGLPVVKKINSKPLFKEEIKLQLDYYKSLNQSMR